MKSEDKDDFYNTVFSELKKMGVKVPKVKKFKSNIPKQEKVVPQSKSKIFGVSLGDQEWTSDSDCLLPKFIASSITYLKKYINEVGLFRKAGSVARQRGLRIKLENGETLEESEPNDVASLLKQWLRELPEPLIPNYMHDLFTRCQQLESSESRVTSTLLTCLLLPPDHLYTLKHLLGFLFEFAANSEKNMMGSRNLALLMAPNIFVLGTDSTEKSSPNQVEMHTSVIQLLIENAEKVGEVPLSVSFQHSAVEGSELDSSGDILDFSPFKSKKKRKSGTVQDLFNGIKKLVGQNATPAASLKNITPEKLGNSLTPAPRSASKRKAETKVDESVSKKLTVAVNEAAYLIGTPKNNKGNRNLSTGGKASSGHTRRKSFGLLRRKEKKKQKSSKESPKTEIVPSVKSPFNWNVDVNTKTVDSTLQVPTLASDSQPGCLSPFKLFCTTEKPKSESIKKSTSDCHLTVPLEKELTLPTSFSQGCLQNRHKTPPYNLRSDKKVEQNEHFEMQKLESLQLKTKNILNNHETSKKHESTEKESKVLHPIEKLPSTITQLNPKALNAEILVKANSELEIQDAIVGVRKRTLLNEPPRQRTSMRKKIESSSNIPSGKATDNNFKSSSPQKNNETSRNANQCSLLSETLLNLDNTQISRRSSNTTFRASRRAGITRQEAFIVKSNQKFKNVAAHTESLDMNSEKLNKKSPASQSLKTGKNHQLRKSKSITLGAENEARNSRNVANKKVTRKNSRMASLVRGRPNTVKSGLPSDLCQRFNNDSFILQTSTANENVVRLNGDNHSFILLTSVAKKNTALLNTEKHSKKKEVLLNIDSQSEKKKTLLNVNKHSQKIELPLENQRNVTPSIQVLSSTPDQEDNGKGENCLIKEQDISLRLQFENVSLSSPLTANEDKQRSAMELNTTFSIEENSYSKLNPKLQLDISFETTLRSGRKLSLPISRGGRASGNSDSKIPRLRNSLGVGRTDSFSGPVSYPKRKVPKNRVSDSLGSPASQIPVKCNDSFQDISTLELSMNDSCFFKTPKRLSVNDSCFKTPNRFSPDSVTWISASKYSGFDSPQEEEEAFNKRESIAMILKSKPGHVQAKVHLWDNKVRETRSVPTYSTPTDAFNYDEIGGSSQKQRSNSQRSRKVLSSSKSYDSSNKVKRGRSQKFPLPPPPKFFISEPDSPSINVSRPLKEVTNISIGMNDSKNSLTNSPLKNESDVIKLSTANNSGRVPQNNTKQKRNSFSGNTPGKFQKKILRSESSPSCRDRLSRLKQESTSNGPFVIKNCENDTFASKHRLLRRSDSKSGSSLSIEKIRSDQMIDEWQYEM